MGADELTGQLGLGVDHPDVLAVAPLAVSTPDDADVRVVQLRVNVFIDLPVEIAKGCGEFGAAGLRTLVMKEDCGPRLHCIKEAVLQFGCVANVDPPLDVSCIRWKIANRL
jgi:hypothetical protein